MDGQKLKHRRKILGLTQAEVAERAGMLQQAYARIETGGRNDPVMSTAESIADALETTLDSLRSNPPKRKAKR
jgi:transcriptional regulator with XRE-family HTH domain